MSRIGANVVLLSGLAASEAITVWAGHRNRSYILVLLFVVWVGSPWFGMVRLASRHSSAPRARKTVDWWVFGTAMASVTVYVLAAVNRLGIKPAFPFLAVPLASWIVIGALALFSPRTSPS